MSPAKITARPDVAAANGGGLAGFVTVVQQLSEAGDDEQRIVDADAEPDHRQQQRCDVVEREDVRAEEQQEESRGHRDDGEDQGYEHRNRGPQQKDQDDKRDGEAHEL